MLVHRVSAHTRSCGTQTVYRTVLDAKLETQVSSQKTKDPPIARAIPVVGAPVLAAAPPPAPTPLSIDGKYQRQNLDAKGMVGTPEVSRSPADGTYLEATTQTFLTGANPLRVASSAHVARASEGNKGRRSSVQKAVKSSTASPKAGRCSGLGDACKSTSVCKPSSKRTSQPWMRRLPRELSSRQRSV